MKTLISISNFLKFAIVIAYLVRIYVCFQHNPCDYLFSDPKRHWLNGERFSHPDLMGASDPILYQIYIFLLRAITEDNRFLIAAASAILSLLMPWFFYRASRELGFRKNAALLAWALIAWTPSLFVIYHYCMMETLLLPFVGASLWMSGRFLRKGTAGSFFATSALWTLSCLTKQTVLPLALVCIGWIWWQRSRSFGLLLSTGAACIVLLIPSALRSQNRLGFPAPFGNPWLTMIQHRSGDKTIRIQFKNGTWGFSSPSCYIQPLLPLSFWAMQRAWTDSEISVTVDPAKGASDWKSAYQNLHVTPQQWITQLGENFLLFLFAPSWPDCNENEWDGWLSYISRWMWAPIIFFVLDCNIRQFFIKRIDLLPLAVTTFILFLAFQNVVTTEGRYRKPLEPLLLMNFVWTLTPTKRNVI
jgi:hypothetical protein